MTNLTERDRKTETADVNVDMAPTQELIAAGVAIKATQTALTEKYRGRRVRIISDFNGQMHGRSRAALTGQILTVRSVDVDAFSVSLFLDGQNVAVSVGEVEFLL